MRPLNDGALRAIFRAAFQANPSPDLNLVPWGLLRRAYVRAQLGAIPDLVLTHPPFSPHPNYALPMREHLQAVLEALDQALVEAGVVRFPPDALRSAYYRANLARAPEGLDLRAWARTERGRLQSAAARVQPNGPGLGGYNIGTMEGWSPADKLDDFANQIDDLDRALVLDDEAQDLAARRPESG